MLLVLQLLDTMMFIAVCFQSFRQLAWPHRNYLLSLLLMSAFIALLRILLNSSKGAIFRGLYICILTAGILGINRISAGLQDIALQLRPDENNPEARYTV